LEGEETKEGGEEGEKVEGEDTNKPLEEGETKEDGEKEEFK